jgi:hypothetical protein
MMASKLLARKTLVLAAIEATPGVDAGPTVADALVVSNASFDFSTDGEELKRDMLKPYLGQLPLVIGRKISKLKFQVEIRSNGITNSGDTATESKLGRLLRACGFAHYPLLNTDTSRVGVVYNDSLNSAPAQAASWVAGGVPDAGLVIPVLYTIQVTSGGASGTATITVTPSDAAGGTAAAATTVTSGTIVALGRSGATVTPTFPAALSQGDTWYVQVRPVGIAYRPISENFETLTLYVYRDGKLHKMTYCAGTAKFSGSAGKFGTVDFEFTGQYVPVSDTPLPLNAQYETTKPQYIQRADVSWGTYGTPIAETFNIDIKNTVEVIPDLNGSDGYNGVMITNREPTGGFDPLATLEADHPFWADFANSKQNFFTLRVGSVPGNMVSLTTPSAQIDKLPYKDRNGFLSYDLTLALSTVLGNDELEVVIS